MKKTQPLISIIIPVFNVEKYLDRCIISIINQTYSKIEIVLVDDGSTDASGKICDKYSMLDRRISVVHKENGGLSDARNAGLERIHGQWVCFVDSDDWVTDNYIELLFSLVESTHSEIAIGTYDLVKEYEKDKTKKYEVGHTVILSNFEAMKRLLYQKGFTTSACAKLYNARLFTEIRFPKGKLYEDVETIYKVIKNAGTVVYTDTILYHYFQRKTGIVRTVFNPQKMDYVENCKWVLSDVRKEYPMLEKAAISRFLWANIHVLVYLDDKFTYHNEFEYLWGNIKKYRRKVIWDKDAKLKNRFVALLTYSGDKVLKSIFKLSKK